MHRRGISALLGFFLLPLISTIASLVAIPFLITTGGPVGWAAVAIGQGVGMTASLVVAFGWQTVGPTEVAQLDPSDQPALYWDSVVMRGALFFAIAPIAAIVGGVLADAEYSTTAGIVAIAFAAQGLGPAWYLTGQSRPYMIAVMETGPRAVAQFLAIGLVAKSGELPTYGAGLLVAEIAIFSTSIKALARRPPSNERSTRQRVLEHTRRQWPLALSALAGAGYTRAAIPIVAIVAYPAIPVFAALDRAQTFARSAVRPMAMFFQSWVVRHGQAQQWKRGCRALTVTVALGLLTGSALALGLPTVGDLVFTTAIHITWTQGILTGVTVAFVSASLGLGLFFLVPLKKVRVFSMTSIAGSALGIPLLLLLSVAAGATGATSAVTMVEGTVVVLQAYFVWRLRPSTQGFSNVA